MEIVAEFEMTFSAFIEAADELISVEKCVHTVATSVLKVSSNVNIGSNTSTIRENLGGTLDSIEHIEKVIGQVRKALIQANNQYCQSEMALLDGGQALDHQTYGNNRYVSDGMGHLNKIKVKIIGEENTSADPFDGNGPYGGNQGDPYKTYKEHPESEEGKRLSAIVRKYYPDYSDQEVRDYLNKLDDEGCGYVAMTNTIFAQYQGKEKEFEETFGFPMYDKKGNLNYRDMVTDFYSATDNHNSKGILWWKHDELDETEDASVIDGKGTTRGEREYRYEMYMKEHGINVDVHNITMKSPTPEAYQKQHEKGDIIMRMSPVLLYNEDGSIACEAEGGHAMTVTGVTDDRLLIVSSWGDKYYVDPHPVCQNRCQ